MEWIAINAPISMQGLETRSQAFDFCVAAIALPSEISALYRHYQFGRLPRLVTVRTVQLFAVGNEVMAGYGLSDAHNKLAGLVIEIRRRHSFVVSNGIALRPDSYYSQADMNLVQPPLRDTQHEIFNRPKKRFAFFRHFMAFFVFFIRILTLRGRRLWCQYNDVRNISRSPVLGISYIVLFITKRLYYLVWHLRARAQINLDDLGAMQDRSVPALAIKIVGGLGDCVVAARFIRDLSATVEDFVFDVYCAHTSSTAWLFDALPQFVQCRSEFLFEETKHCYDASLYLGHTVVIDIHTDSSTYLSQTPLLYERLLAAKATADELQIYFDKRPRLDNQFARMAVAKGATRMDFAHHIFKLPADPKPFPLAIDKAKVEQHGLEAHEYLSIHNGYDPNVVVVGRQSTKFYRHFDRVIAIIKEKMPQIKVVQLGTRTSVPIANIDIDLLNKTSLPEAAAIIAGALCHIDVESGLVHLAHGLGTPSVVVFGPTPTDYFGYSTNENVPPQTCGDCWATHETWMSFCRLGLKQPACTEQPPERVADAIIALSQRARSTS